MSDMGSNTIGLGLVNLDLVQTFLQHQKALHLPQVSLRLS